MRKHGIRNQKGEVAEAIQKDKERLKSPSDMTIYAPALNRTPDRNVVQLLNNSPSWKEGSNVPNQISDFVDQMRKEAEVQQPKVRSQVVEVSRNIQQSQPQPSTSR